MSPMVIWKGMAEPPILLEGYNETMPLNLNFESTTIGRELDPPHEFGKLTSARDIWFTCTSVVRGLKWSDPVVISMIILFLLQHSTWHCFTPKSKLAVFTLQHPCRYFSFCKICIIYLAVSWSSCSSAFTSEASLHLFTRTLTDYRPWLLMLRSLDLKLYDSETVYKHWMLNCRMSDLAVKGEGWRRIFSFKERNSSQQSESFNGLHFGTWTETTPHPHQKKTPSTFKCIISNQ